MGLGLFEIYIRFFWTCSVGNNEESSEAFWNDCYAFDYASILMEGCKGLLNLFVALPVWFLKGSEDDMKTL